MKKIAFFSAAAALCFALPCEAQSPAQRQQNPATDETGGVLEDGTIWRVIKPGNWNGTLLLDLDAAGQPAAPGGQAHPRPLSPFVVWLLAQGYAYGGTQREPVGYDFPKAVDNLLAVRRQFATKWRMPIRTISTGGSRGGFVVRKSLELHPEVFDGGLVFSGGGAGEIAVLNNKLNALFVLKTLVDPTSPLHLVNVNPAADQRALELLVDKANSSPQGRARLALAGAVEEFALWSSRAKPKPAQSDYEAQVSQMAENFVFGTALPVRAGVEKLAGGNVSWNLGVDYAVLLQRSGRQAMARYLYAKAGISLAADLAKLAKAPRIIADPVAVRRAEPLMTYTGRIRVPLVNVDNDDPVDPASDKLVYLSTLKRAGTAHLFKLIWADQAGHGGQSDLDRAVGFRVLMERLNSGRWSNTSLAQLSQLADEIKRTSLVDLGQFTLFEPGRLPEPLHSWDSARWKSYSPSRRGQ